GVGAVVGQRYRASDHPASEAVNKTRKGEPPTQKYVRPCADPLPVPLSWARSITRWCSARGQRNGCIGSEGRHAGQYASAVVHRRGERGGNPGGCAAGGGRPGPLRP